MGEGAPGAAQEENDGKADCLPVVHGKQYQSKHPHCSPKRAHTGAGYLTGTVAHGGPQVEQSAVPERLYLMERILSGAVLAELHPVGRTYVREVHEGLSPAERGTV